MNQSKETFSIKDLVSATYIAYNGVKFATGYDQRSKSWVFQDPEKCKQLDLQLRNGETSVEVLRYESTRRMLLGMVSSGQ